MKATRLLDRRAGYSLASIGLLLGMVAPSLMPAFASADVMTTRSIEMSSAAASGTSVGYEVKATLPTGIPSGGGAIIQFCDSSSGPLLDTACTKPTGMTVAGVGVGSGGGTAADIDSTDHATIQWTAGSAISASGSLDVAFTGITNPSTTGTFYARITTYTDTNMSGGGAYADATHLGTYSDSGAVALSTTASVGVTAYVLESMIFCVSHTAPSSNCTSTDSPSMTIGESVGNSQLALDTGHVSTGTDYMSLSTNASSGAVVNLKSDATSCGGLKLVGGTGCIPGQGTGTVTAGTAGFGLKLGTVTNATGSSGQSGTLEAASGSIYDNSHYLIDSASDNTSGVTSTYGSEFVDTSGAPVSNKSLDFTVGATIGNSTPAGKYTANLNMIATGTF